MESILNLTLGADPNLKAHPQSSGESDYEVYKITRFYEVADQKQSPPVAGAQHQQQQGGAHHDSVWVYLNRPPNSSDPHLNHRQRYAVIPSSSINEIQSLNLGWPVKIPGALIRLLQSYMGLINSDETKERGTVVSLFSKLMELGIETRYQKDEY